jgi:hypothetical protein
VLAVLCVVCLGWFDWCMLLQISTAFEDVCRKIERAVTEEAALAGVDEIVKLRTLSKVLSDFFATKFRKGGGEYSLFFHIL